MGHRSERDSTRHSRHDKRIDRSHKRSHSGNHDKNRSKRYRHEESKTEQKTEQTEQKPQEIAKTTAEILEEANKYRLEIGLKLITEEDLMGETSNLNTASSLNDVIHKPAINFGDQQRHSKTKERLDTLKEKNRLKAKYSHVQQLGDVVEEEESLLDWINKSRSLDEQKRAANIKMENINDEENLLADPSQPSLRVLHDIERFVEGREVILTLKDKDVLDEEEDELVNVNLVDVEKGEEFTKNSNVLSTSKFWGEDDFANEYRENKFDFNNKKLLSQYNERIDGKQIKSFKLDEGKCNINDHQTRSVKLKPKGMIDISTIITKQVTDYLVPSEVELKIKKVNKKRKIRKIKKEIDLPEIEISGDLDFGDNDVLSDKKRSEICEIENLIKQNADSLPYKVGLVIDDTAEFCQEVKPVPLQTQISKKTEKYEESDDSDEVFVQNCSEKNMDESNQDEPTNDNVEPNLFNPEPTLDGGLSGALHLAQQKGYIRPQNNETEPEISEEGKEISSRNVIVEFRRVDEGDSKQRRRETRYDGHLSDFKEKKIVPRFKLEYTNNKGEIIPPKEAFRSMSHIFHGKGPGKPKLEKRAKRAEDDKKFIGMSGDDTPLMSLKLLKDRQKKDKSAYLVIGGGKYLQGDNVQKK